MSAAGFALAVLVALLLFLMYDVQQQAADSASKRAAWVVQFVARDYERLINEARLRLLDVGERRETVTLDPRACELLSQRLGSIRGYIDATLAHPNGDIVCTARRGERTRTTPVPLPLNSGTHEARFARYAIDPVTRHGVANLVAPTLDDTGAFRAMLGVTVDLMALPLGVVEAGLPHDASVVVVDSNGIVLAHSAAPTIGEFLPQSVTRRLGARAAGSMDATDLTGAPAHLVFAPLARDGAHFGDASAVVLLPRSALLQHAAWRTARPFGGMLLAVLVLAALGLAVFDSSIMRPAAVLAQGMKRLAAAPGESVAPHLVVEGACGPLRDAINAYETVASRVIEQEACTRLLQQSLLDGESTDRGEAPAPHVPQRAAAGASQLSSSEAPTRQRFEPPRSPHPRRHAPAPMARREPVEAHWGLAEPAFENAPNPKFLYLSPGHEAVLRGLTYAVRQRRGCGVLVGKPGCGKTTLVRSLIQRLEADRYDVAFLLRPPKDPDDMLREVLYELGVQTDERRRSELLHLIGARFVNNFGRHRETVIIVDEAQLASARTLKELGLLLNYQSNERSLVTLVLAGSLELGERLATSDQLDGRLGVRCRIAPLDAEHTGKYVTHRLTVAGGAATIFTGDALRLIHEMTDGIPRAINDVCDNVLLLGSLNAVGQIDAETLRSMLRPAVPSSDRAFAFDLPATWLAHDRPAADLR